MILKLTTNDKASIWVNLSRILQMTLIDAQDGYAVHRFVLHDLAPKEHGLHHANPDEAVLTIFWQIWICFALVYFIAGGAFLAGALAAYAWYLLVHHCAHHGHKHSRLALLKHHRSHHKFATRDSLQRAGSPQYQTL
jgi:hypothetical protein